MLLRGGTGGDDNDDDVLGEEKNKGKRTWLRKRKPKKKWEKMEVYGGGKME